MPDNKYYVNMEFEEFDEDYAPLWNNDQDFTPLRIEPKELQQLMVKVPSLYKKLKPFIWTEMDNDDLQSGVHIVNRLYYWLAQPPPNDTEVYVKNSDDDDDDDTDVPSPSDDFSERFTPDVCD